MTCPCGCGESVPRDVGNVWHDAPYWAWYCTHKGCERFQVEQKNQSGDRECPWCHHDRHFVGHFASASPSRKYRLTVKGERVWFPRADDKHLSPVAL